ncbi:MAG: sugar nucleotide-binding protein, partial [Steroidobacteraceae bacterium]
MRVLVFGAGGQVGKAVAATAPAGAEVIAKARAALDITDASAVARVMTDNKPDWVINAGAYTAVDLAEDEPAKAAAINDIAVG